ncbi:MAG TPA: ABC transporter ATP-binding protein, partial [Chloroflexota bacterium]|nr:ABC transporter ATP-binding protein [Chloroflexota bacterium]
MPQPVTARPRPGFCLLDGKIATLVALGTSQTPMGMLQRQLGLHLLPLANRDPVARTFETGLTYCSGRVEQDESVSVGVRDSLGVRSMVASAGCARRAQRETRGPARQRTGPARRPPSRRAGPAGQLTLDHLALALSAARMSGRSGTLRGALALAAPWRGTLGLVAALVLVAAGLELVPPLVLRRTIDEHLTTGRADGLLPLAALYLAATAATELVSFGYAYLTAVAAQGALHALRVRLFAHLQRLPLAYYDRTPLGDAISRCTADVEAVDTLFSAGVTKVVGDVVRLATAALAMLALSPPLAAIAALTIPPLVWVTNVFRRGVSDAERANRRAVGQLNTHLQETLGGVEVIRAFAREETFVQRFRRALRDALAAFNRATFYAAIYPPVMALLAALATALLLWGGTRESLAAWGISLGTLTAFVLVFGRFFKPLTALGDEWQTVQAALSGLERIQEVLDLPPDLPPVPASAPPYRPATVSDALIQVRDVTFGYLPERPVLRGVSLFVQPGEHVALVGRTGAGKSTLVHLAGGLYAPWSGRVSLAGADPRAVPDGDRRRLVAAVPQVVQLFTGTVRENLTLGDDTVSENAVRRAAALAGAAGFIDALPRGYHTLLAGSGRGEGAQLSAGQRQLISLARALVWEPRVLLLDEATAAIDGASDAAFRAGLRQGILARGGAVLSVAHRLSTARE